MFSSSLNMLFEKAQLKRLLSDNPFLIVRLTVQILHFTGVRFTIGVFRKQSASSFPELS